MCLYTILIIQMCLIYNFYHTDVFNIQFLAYRCVLYTLLIIQMCFSCTPNIRISWHSLVCIFEEKRRVKIGLLYICLYSINTINVWHVFKWDIIFQ